MNERTTDEPRALLRSLFDAAVARAQPAQAMQRFLPPPPARGRTLVLGAGKAGGAMAAALDALWPRDAALSGLVVTRYGHVPAALREQPGRIEVVEAAHPVPDAAGQRAAQRIVELTRGLGADDLVLCLISGGGSALLSLPADGLTLADKQQINQALLASGAAIGRLATRCAPAPVVTLVISDVPGDDPSIIASGPTVPDASTCADALRILARYRIPIPQAARVGLESGAFETPKPGDAAFRGHAVHVIATPQQSLEAAAASARERGLHAFILSDEIEGESREVGKVHAALARAVRRRGQPFAKPCLILSGGETTVTVRAAAGRTGRGGRATEFLLGCALALQAEPGVWVLAADTDGIDGVEHNAGAIVTPDTLARGAALGLKAADHLDRHDAFGFFEPLGDLVVTGPTLTNVNDFRALLIR